MAEVWVDGAKVNSADLYASSAQPRKMIYAKSQMNPLVSHSIEVRVLGTKNASSSGTRVDVDAFVVLSSPCRSLSGPECSGPDKERQGEIGCLAHDIMPHRGPHS